MAETVLTYEYDSEIGGYTVTGFSSIADDGNVEIPQNYNDGNNGEQPVIKIGQGVFSSCWTLTSVTIPDSITTIDDYAFSNCMRLTSVTIPDSVKSIGNYAFTSCIMLTSITIPYDVKSIGINAFSGCDSIISIEVNENNATYKDIDGNLYTKNGKQLIQYANGKSDTIFVIPNSVTSIDDYAFYNCRSLTSVTIPNSVKSIGNRAFNKCSSLMSMIIPSSVTSIGNYAFSYCTSLMSMTIPGSVTSLGSAVFYNCTSLTSVTIGNNVRTIGNYMFRSCSSLTDITIPDSVTSIGIGAFSYCTSLTSIIIGNNVRTIYDYAFLQCSNLTSVTIGNGVTSIGSYAFSLCIILNIVNLSTSNCNISSTAFESCSNIAFILPTGVKVLDYRKTLQNYPYSATNASLKIDYLPSTNLDFLGFTFNGKHSLYDLNVYRVSDGDRYNNNLSPELQDKTAEVPGGDGAYYFGTTHKSKKFSINIAFDGLTEGQLRKWKQFCAAKEMGDLIFDEAPYKAYTAKITGSPSMKYICFTINGERIYKGEGTIEFTCYWPYAHTIDNATKVSSKLSSSGTFGADGKLLENYPEIIYATKNEWAPSSGLQESTELCVGKNPGDLPAPFVLQYAGNNIGKGHTRIFTVGELSITITNNSTQDYVDIQWDSKTGLVTVQGDTEDAKRKIIPATGTPIGTIPVGEEINITIKQNKDIETINDIRVQNGQWQKFNGQWTNINLSSQFCPILAYHYWYY